MFQCIEDETGSVSEVGHQIKGSAKVSANRAMRDSLAAVITQKAATSSNDPMQLQLAIEDEKPKPREVKERRPPTEQEKKQRDFDKGMSQKLFFK